MHPLIAAWRTQCRINRFLLQRLPPKGLAAVPTGSRGRTVARVFVHLHRVRLGWTRFNLPRLAANLPRFAPREEPSRARLRTALAASGKAVETVLTEALAGRHRVKFFRGDPTRWVAYLISHESHHQGQIALALKQNGMRLPDDVAIRGLWYEWYWGNVVK